MGRIKLGAEAKDFYPQELVLQRMSGWRVEESVRPMTSSEFKVDYGMILASRCPQDEATPCHIGWIVTPARGQK